MPHILRLSSDKFPSISIPVPHLPGNESIGGSFDFHVNQDYTVTSETLKAVRRVFQSLPLRIRNHFFLSVSDPAPAPVVVGSPEPEKDEPTVDPLNGLKTEDVDVVETELNKLRGLTLTEAIPLLEKFATDEENHSKTVRLAYLNQVNERVDLQVTLRRRAVELIDLIDGDSD